MVAPATHPCDQLEAIVTDNGCLSVSANAGIAIKARSGKRVDFMMGLSIRFDSVNVFKSSFGSRKSLRKNERPGLLALPIKVVHRVDQPISPVIEGALNTRDWVFVSSDRPGVGDLASEFLSYLGPKAYQSYCIYQKFR